MTIEESLRRDLSYNGTKFSDNSADRKENELDLQIVCSSKQVLMRQIDFKPAKTQMKYQVQQLRNKYILLNPSENNVQHQSVLCSKDGSVKRERLPSQGESDDSESTIELPKPAHVIYPASKIKLGWQVNRSIGCTLANQGNTCFMNSVLQCLTYTPPLYNYYQTGHHKQTCKRPGLCVMCTIENHVHMVMKQPVHVITPVVLTSKFRNIQKQMETGRQHDVHEFLRVLLEEMHKSCLYGFSKDMDRLTEETSAVYQVFGGKIRNRIFCTNCKYRSDTFETFLDLPLDLKSKSIEQCLRIMMKPEMLFGDNKYKCSGCKKLVDARKTFRIVKPPNVLTVVLKRYDASGRNIKNKRFIEYPEYFDLRPFMAGAKKPVKYKLYGVLPHEGNGSGYGHYYTYVRAPNNLWYKMNDHASDRAGRHHVMNSEAYLLFYVRIPDNDVKSTENGRVQPVRPKLNHTYVNGTSFAPISSKVPPVRSMQQREEQRHNIPTVLKPPTAAAMPSSLPRDRAKLSFTINRKGVQSNTVSPKPNGSSKPSSIGNTLSRSTAESFVKPKVHTESPNKSHTSPKITTTSLVPYGSDSSDSEDYDDIAAKLSGKDSNQSTVLAQKSSDTDQKSSVKEETKTSPLSNHKNLMAVRSTDSPLRLTITTNCNASKLTSTGLWKVSADAEPQTPSVASDASNTSASSTSEWNVQEKKMLTPLPKESSCEAEFLGWTVSQKPDSVPSTPCLKNSSSSFPEKRSQLNERHSGSGNTQLQPPMTPEKIDKPSTKSRSNNFENNKQEKQYSNGHQNGHSYQQMDNLNGHIHDQQNSKPVTNNKTYNLKRQFSKSDKPKCDSDDESKKSKMAESSTSDNSWKQSNITSTAPSQAWDHHVRDGYHRKDHNKTTSRYTWDGRDNGTSSKEVNKVLGSTSMRSYGSSVKSWDEGPSEIDIQAKRSWRQEKRVKRDSYEEELDRGKMKKNKSNDFRERHHHGYNAFQRYQNHHNNLPPQSPGFYKQPYVQGYNRFHPYRNRHGWNSNKTWRR